MALSSVGGKSRRDLTARGTVPLVVSTDVWSAGIVPLSNAQYSH